MDSIAEDFKSKGIVRHRPPRSFDSYCEALGRSRQKPASPTADFAQPGVIGFRKAVLPERGSSKAAGPSGLVLSSPTPGEDSDSGAPETVEETAVPESTGAV
ncbi:MAG: hypothetical protein P8J87_05895, partial [Verrucomicrobiales bacterium]|nr:hypothetical protein [Verrucomicrobiales bacterium]